MRALVISDTHFGAWTGEDLLRHNHELDLLAPHLDDVDEVIFLGDLFDFLFASVEDAVAAAGGLLDLLADKLQGKRLVFLAGNHDHHLIAQQAQDVLELTLATGGQPQHIQQLVSDRLWFRRLLERRLDGVQVELHYPTYTFGRVLCTHGHYLDYHAHRHGSLPNRLLGRALWSIATGGQRTSTPNVEDYESVITLLTQLLYTIAQLPHGTAAQHNVYDALQHAETIVDNVASPARGVKRLGLALAQRINGGPSSGAEDSRAATRDDYERARVDERERRRTLPGPGGTATGYNLARVTRPNDPPRPAVDAFDRVVQNLGWARGTDQIVFAHTHQPLADVQSDRDGRVRYWNTGSWIYEPDLSSHDAYVSYLEKAWPGTAVLIDTDEPAPRLLEIRRHLSPLEARNAPT